MSRKEYNILLISLVTLVLVIWSGVNYIGWWAALVWFGSGALGALITYITHEEWPRFSDLWRMSVIHDVVIGSAGLYQSLADLPSYIRWRNQRGFLLWQCFGLLVSLLAAEAAASYWLYAVDQWALIGVWIVVLSGVFVWFVRTSKDAMKDLWLNTLLTVFSCVYLPIIYAVALSDPAHRRLQTA